jgi:hypothetical protein
MLVRMRLSSDELDGSGLEEGSAFFCVFLRQLYPEHSLVSIDVYKCLGIVLGTEPNLTPLDDDGTPIAKTSEQTQATITSWQTRHALAREALLKCLEPAELIKVLPFRRTAAAIWIRLQQECGRPLDFEYIRVNNEYMNLRRTENISITDHIDRFNQLLQELEYRPSAITPLQPESVNLQFMISLGPGWDTFILAKGDWIQPLNYMLKFEQ